MKVFEAKEWAAGQVDQPRPIDDGAGRYKFRLASLPDNVASCLEGRNDFGTVEAAWFALSQALTACGFEGSQWRSRC